MRTTTRFFAAILLSLAGLVGCAADTGAPGPGGGGPGTGGTTEPLACDSGASYFYLINFVDIPEADPAGSIPGFDLDGVASEEGDAAGCGHADFTSPDGAPGVDNQLAVLANQIRATLDIGQGITDAIQEGSFAVVAEVQNVDDFTNDDCVNVNLGLGYLPGGGAPELGADGRPVAGQLYDTHYLAEVSGRITNGRLETDPIRFESELTLVEPAVPIVIEGARLSASISDTRIDDGVIGGKVEVSVLQTAVIAMKPEMADLASFILSAQADLDPDGGSCSAMSAGFSFAGVDAVQGAPR
jgi:hypothetical protein